MTFMFMYVENLLFKFLDLPFEMLPSLGSVSLRLILLDCCESKGCEQN
jgi:hypothetical protein